MLKPAHRVSFYAQFRDDSHDLLQQMGAAPKTLRRKSPSTAEA